MFDFLLNAESNIFLLVGALIVGFVLIIFGGDKFVESAIWIAVKTKIPQMIIGATIVAIGTALPETLTSFMAAGKGETAMAVGNAFGSILCNTALVLSISLIANPSKVDRKEFYPKYIFLVGSVIILLFFSLTGVVEIWQSAIMLVICALYIAYSIIVAIKKMKQPIDTDIALHPSEYQPEVDQYAEYHNKKAWVMILMFFVGAIAIALGADFLVNSVSGICEKVGIPKDIIALTVVAFGTSLPELVTAINSLKKNSAEMAVGNIIGANILNATLIVGGSGLIGGGLVIDDALTMGVTVGITLVVFAVVGIPILTKKRTYKFQGITCLSLYGLYLGFLIFQLVTNK